SDLGAHGALSDAALTAHDEYDVLHAGDWIVSADFAALGLDLPVDLHLGDARDGLQRVTNELGQRLFARVRRVLKLERDHDVPAVAAHATQHPEISERALELGLFDGGQDCVSLFVETCHGRWTVVPTLADATEKVHAGPVS